MSLRGFHIVFITICTMLFGFLTAWGFLSASSGFPLALPIAYVGVAGLVALPFYGVYFYRKAKRLHL